MTQPLLAPFLLGDLVLPNRVVMAAMTRARADNPDLAPTELHAEYYAQRATAGLLLTEGTWPSADAIGYINVPGIYTDTQTLAWHRVTDAVHAAGGRIFAQLGHTGAVSHPDLRDGVLPAGPSAINPQQPVYTPRGFEPTLTPREMTIDDIRRTIAGYRDASARARRAGFDGIELHGSHVFLIPQFLNAHLNQRTDAYGGSPAGRARFLLEALDAILAEWPPHRVGLKLAPTVSGVGALHATDDTVPTHEHILAHLNNLPLAFLELSRPATAPTGTPVEWLHKHLYRHARTHYRGTLIANGGLTPVHANFLLSEGLADLISFGVPFIANPDLVERFAANIPLAQPDPDTFYQGGRDGYTTYPRAGSLP